MKIDWDWVWITILLIIVFGLMLTVVVSCNQDMQVSNLCIRNGYAGRTVMAGQNYCYRLDTEGGALVRADKFREEK